MSHATSAIPACVVPDYACVVLDWRHGTIGPLAPCVLCGAATICRSPVKNAPCHKACAEAWITRHARDDTDLARLIRTHTPGTG